MSSPNEIEVNGWLPMNPTRQNLNYVLQISADEKKKGRTTPYNLVSHLFWISPSCFSRHIGCYSARFVFFRRRRTGLSSPTHASMKINSRHLLLLFFLSLFSKCRMLRGWQPIAISANAYCYRSHAPGDGRFLPSGFWYLHRGIVVDFFFRVEKGK